MGSGRRDCSCDLTRMLPDPVVGCIGCLDSLCETKNGFPATSQILFQGLGKAVKLIRSSRLDMCRNGSAHICTFQKTDIHALCSERAEEVRCVADQPDSISPESIHQPLLELNHRRPSNFPN